MASWDLLITPGHGLDFISENRSLVRPVLTARRRAWRLLAFRAAERAQLPQGLERIQIDVKFIFKDHMHRDAANYEPTSKPIVDGLCGRRVYGNGRRGQTVTAPGYGLVSDDTPAHVDGPHLTIGEPHPLGRRFPYAGQVLVRIVELEAS